VLHEFEGVTSNLLLLCVVVIIVVFVAVWRRYTKERCSKMIVLI
jgi:hypothetical protein